MNPNVPIHWLDQTNYLISHRLILSFNTSKGGWVFCFREQMLLVEREQCLNFIFPFSLKISTIIIKINKKLTIKCGILLFLIFRITQNLGSMIIETRKINKKSTQKGQFYQFKNPRWLYCKIKTPGGLFATEPNPRG